MNASPRRRGGRPVLCLAVLVLAVSVSGCTSQVHDLYACNRSGSDVAVTVEFFRKSLHGGRAESPSPVVNLSAPADAQAGPVPVSLRSGEYDVQLTVVEEGGNTTVQRGFRVTYGDPFDEDSLPVMVVFVHGPEQVAFATSSGIPECA